MHFRGILLDEICQTGQEAVTFTVFLQINFNFFNFLNPSSSASLCKVTFFPPLALFSFILKSIVHSRGHFF